MTISKPLRRTPKRITIKARTGLDSAINVTPLVDVVLVLLIIFMVVTPSLERQVSVQVPVTAMAPANDRAPHQIVVALNASSGVTIDAVPVDENDYVTKVRERLQGQTERVVFFVAADGASYQKLIVAMDGAKRAGADSLAFVTDAE